MRRRQFLSGALAASVMPCPKVHAQERVPLGDLHFHSFFGESVYHSRPVAKTMRDGGATLVSWAISADALWIKPSPKGFRQTSEPQAGEAQRWFQRDLARIKAHLAEQRLPIVTRPQHVDRALAGEPHVVLASEGGNFIEGDARRVQVAFDSGLRHLQLVHYTRNTLGDFQTEKPEHNGLTALGKEVVRECNRLGILVDLAHCSPKAVDDALAVATAPPVWSHSSVVRTAQPSWSEVAWRARRLHLEQARAIAAKGGVIGLWALRQDVQSIEGYAARMLELADWLGDDHVAFGTDINGLYTHGVVNSYADLRRVVETWQQRNVDPARIRKLAIGNFARVLKRALQTA